MKKPASRTFVLGVTGLLLCALPYVHAQFGADAYQVKTIHIFPAQVEAEGWQNAETITFQNLDEYALLQEFNTINSATIDPSRKQLLETPVSEVIPEETNDISAESDGEENELSPEHSTTTNETKPSATDFRDQTTSTSSAAVDEEALATTTESTASEEIPAEPAPTTTEPVVPPAETAPENTVPESESVSEDPATTTVMQRAQSLFALAVAAVTSVFDGSTTTEPVATDETSDHVDGPIVETSFAEPEETTAADPTATSAEEADEESVLPAVLLQSATTTATTSVIATSTPTTTSGTADAPTISTSSPAEPTPPSAAATPITENDAGVETPVQCTDNCLPYSILLSDFSFPLDEEVDVSGAQLRLSFAAKKKATREHIPMFSVRYTTDGTNWQTGGSVVLDDEASNSINGGYYLFALPDVIDQATLNALQVELLYQDDLAIMQELYVESAWLELFVLEAPEYSPTDYLSELLLNDGYTEAMLTGDELTLPDGEQLEFNFTDNNEDETLIIKSNEHTYEGFSEATTYFSVTNTANRDDEFTVQAYFPDGVGEVTSLEVFTQNKPKQLTIPEYRPYVYHCEAGWEYAGEVPTDSLQELSQRLSTLEEPSVTPVADETSTTTVETATASDEPAADFSLPTSTDAMEPPTPDTEFGTTTTTTVFNRLPSVTELLQFSTTTDVEVIDAGASPVATGTTTVTGEASGDSELVPVYACRNTNVVRECDELDGANTACRVNQVKVAEHAVTHYTPGWEAAPVTAGEMPQPGFFKRAAAFIGFGPDRKEVPETFEVRAHTADTHIIRPGETLFFKLDISFPPFSRGEYWIEAIGDREYGLLDPFWSSNWTYRMPIQVANPTGADQTEYQVFFELDSALSDFWSNVNSDGSDIRFIQETPNGNFSNADTAVLNWLDFDFGHRVPIEIPAGTVTEDLVNFPVSIDLSTLDSTFWSHVKADGGDIRMYTTDDTELPIALTEIDTTAQTGALHFLADTLSAHGANTFYLYFDNAALSGYAPTAPLGSEAVWAGYNAVYHFTDDPGAVSNVIADATGNGRDLVVASAALATTSGQFGSAIDFTAGSGYLVDADWNFQAGNPLNITGAYFMSTANGEALWQWGTGNQPNTLRFEPWYGGDDGRFTFANTSGDEYVNRVSYATTTWHAFGTMGATSTSENNYVYEDGLLVETLLQNTANPSNTTGGGFQVGRDGGGGSWSGYIDELRVSTSTRSQAWIRAETVNLYQPTQFYTPRQTQTPNNAASRNWYSTSWEQRIRLSIPAASLTEDLTDFPVYLDLATLGSAFHAGVTADGRDVRITLGDGVTEVPLEIVTIDTGAGTGELYFKADLSDTAANDFYVYFDNPDVSAYARDDAYGSEQVWTNGFQAVYHLQEDAPGTGNPDVYKDSTSNQYHGDDENTSTGKEGLFGAGQQFGASQLDYLSLPHQVMDGLTDNSVSWWHISSTTGDQTIVSGANTTQFNEFWTRFDNNTLLLLYFQGSAETFNLSDTVVNYNNNTWQYYMTTGEEAIDEVNLYVNGVGDTENPDPQPIVVLDIAPGGLIIGQDQDALGGNFSSAENFEGILDELRFASVVRSAGWAAAVYENMANQTSFIATSSAEELQATNFVELDFWLQHFDSTNDEADIWVQVADLPAGEETVIYLYYGNAGAPSVSDELATFSYSTSTDLYYVVDASGVVQVSVQSLIDNNQVSLDGGASIPLNQGESTTFNSVSPTSVISALGPLSGTLTGPGSDGGDSIAPISFATTTFAVPLNRSPDRWYLLAPFASTTVRTYIGNSGTADQTFNLTAGGAATATTDPADSGTGTDGSGVVVEASSPVLLTHRHTGPGDGLVAYPPTTRDIFGVDSQYFQISATADNPNPTVTCSSGASAGLTGTTRGEKDDITECTTGPEGAGNAVRFSGAVTPIAGVQQADSDGNEATAFWGQHDFGTRYAMTNDSAYAAIVCSPRFGAVTLEVQDAAGNTIEAGSCTPTATAPGKAYFNNGNGSDGDAVNFTAGHQIVSTNGVPFYVIYEDVSVDQDEKNIAGPVQARKQGGEYTIYTFGPQELTIDAKWEQLSFGWYENNGQLTPTSTWMVGTELVPEGQAITGAGAVDNGDHIRLRINLEASNATGTINTNAFTLQYGTAAAGQCSALSLWYDIGEQGSTTAAFSGYDNAGVADGVTLTTTTLASSTILGTYEERNFSDFLPADVPVGEVVEYDWVLEATNITVNTNYCFRLVRAEGASLETYTVYPELETVGPPNVPSLAVFFDNERTTALTPVLEFAATDNASDDINYQVQIDDTYDFSSVVLDRNSNDHFTEFENVDNPADKAPFTSGSQVRFTAGTALSPTTTYYWRVRADDPTGSATSSGWSTPFSFTTDTTLSVSEWFQTTDEQFNTNANTGVSVSGGAVSLAASPGTMVSTPIDFDDGTVGNAWGEIDWNDTETSGEIVYQVEYNNNGSWTLVPDALIAGNSVGTSTGPISLLDLDTATYNEIRLVATLTGTTLSIEDWVVRWGLRVETPVQGDLFDNEKTAATLPVFDFISNDPQGDDLEYEISFSTDVTFESSSTTYNSSTSAQFANTVNGGDASPFTTGERITFTTPAALTNGTTYWWRTRARDPEGGNAWSPWAEPDSFTVDTGVVKSTWFQTTAAQFTEGILDGTFASTSGSVELTNQIGEYGTANLTNNNWLTVNTQRTYSNMVVVVSPEYDGSAWGNNRNARVRNKTSDSFEVKVDNYTNGFTGSTVVDYLVVEAGTWTLDEGGAGVQLVAGTAEDVSAVQARSFQNNIGTELDFSATPFAGAPVGILTVSSNNDSDWIGTHMDGNGADHDVEITTTMVQVALNASYSGITTHSPEDIDYVIMDVADGTVNGGDFEAFNSADAVDDTQSNGGHAQSFQSGFGSTPQVTLVQNNAEDGGDGGFGIKDTSGVSNASQIFLSVMEGGAGANGHTQEIVSVVAFEGSSGVITRLDSGTLSGTIAGEDIIFSDGAGPKFDTFSWSASSPGASTVNVQMQYQVSEGVYALVPDAYIPGNSTGTTTSPIDLTNVDINVYPTIRAFATLTCGGGGCPTLDDWQLEWSEGVSMSGTLREYDRLTAVATGTVRAAVNGSLVTGSGTVSGGVWSMPNVTAFAGDIVTVWVDGAAEVEEAVAAFVYDGVGDITGVELFQQHLSISADELGTTTNALLALNDSTALGEEDIFYEVDLLGNLTVCGQGTCADANLYVGPGNVYIPNAAGGVAVDTHDFVNDGVIELDSNTLNVSGSWDNNATSSTDTSTINFTAATGTESVASTETPLNFHHLSFGAGAGNATFTIAAALDLSGDLTVASGTLARDGHDIALAGSLTTGAAGYWSGTGTTTFDGSGGKTWTDNNATVQNIGNVVIDGASTFVTVTTDVSAYDVTIGTNDTLAGGTGNVISVGGDWTNHGTFNAESSTVEIVVDDRSYPPVVLGSQDWYTDTNFQNRLPIVIQDSEVPGDLTGFPVYVNLAHLGADFWNNVRSDGADIRLTSGNGQTELPHEVVEFDATAQTGELHFLADAISSTATTTFYLYYNNPSAAAYAVSDPYGRNAVWAEYEAVYHFTEDPTTIGNSITDATGNNRNLAVEGAVLASSSGQLGRGVSLVGSAGLLRASSFTWAAGSPLTTSGWYKMTAASGEALWQFGTGAQPNNLFFEPWDSGGTRGEYNFGNTSGDTYNFSPRDTLNWNHFFTLGATSTSESNYVYHDNILRETQSQTIANPSNTNASGLQVGRTGTVGSIAAEVDELRFAAVLRNTDWMTAEYNNQHTPGNFYATSSAETYVPDQVIDEATHIITTGGSAFNHLTFTDATTTPAFTEPSVVVNGDFTIATGTVALPTAKLTVGGSFLNSGYFMHNNAEVEFISGSNANITLNGTEFFNTFYDVSFDGAGTFTFTDTNATSSHDFTIEDGTVIFPSGVLAIGGRLANTGGVFDANGGLVVFTSTDNETITTNGSSFDDVSFGSIGSATGWYDAAWGGRMEVTIASTSVVGTINNFPVYVNLTDFGPAFWSMVASDGADIRVTTANGTTERPVEVVEIDVGAETGELHFLASSISSVVDTTYYVYFDNPDATSPATDSTYGAENVWTNYEAVYHFSDDPALGVRDVSGNGRDLVPAVGAPAATTGLIGTALDTTSSNVMLADADWTWPAGQNLISSGLYFQSNFDTGALWQWGTSCTGDNCLAFLPWYDNATRGYHRFGETSGNDYNFTRNSSAWHHFTTIGRAASGESVEIYEDNVQRDVYTQTGSGANPSQTGLQIGRYLTSTYMDIDVDELRFTTVIPSTNWIETEYNNLTNAAAFYSTSSQAYLEVVPSFTLSEATTNVAGDVTINYANLVAPSVEFSIGGSAQNIGGSYDPNNATTTFDSNNTGETVAFGDGAFYNLAFDGVGGGWTISTTTVTNNASLVTGADFTLATNTAMTVGGRFSNTFASAATDWTNSTLILTGGDYIVTDRLDAGDSYATLVVSNDSDIVIWNSSISTSSVRDTSSVYMPDYGSSDGELRIFGEYVRTTGTEHWSYATDFDGTDLTGGSERPVTVQIGRGADITLATSTTLAVRGVAGGTTTVTALSGIYALTLNAGTLDVNYASFADGGKDGLVLTGGTIVSSLANADFTVAGGRSGLTVDAATINAGPSSEFSGLRFATSSASGIYEADWSDQVIVTIQSSQVDETLTDYVVYVDLSTLGASFWSGVQSDGRDVRVTTDSGVELPIDLVEIDVAAETGELHFLAPTISASEDAVFYIHFNNPTASAYAPSDEYGANAVWVNYEAVYHFAEDPTVRITDMTGNGRDLLPTVGTPATTTGQLGTALDTTGSSVALQAAGWSWPAGEDLISSGLYFQSAVDTGALWQFGTACVTDDCLAFMPWYDSGNRGYHRFGETTGNDYRFTRNNTIWHHFTTIGRATAGEAVEIYEDTVLRDTYNQTVAGENPSQTGLQIGRYTTGTYMDINIDELRFATTVPSISRMETEYTNFMTPTTFYATSSEQTIFHNVTAAGIPTTFWLFSNGTGDIYGEAYDNDDGDPGSIQWDDSNFAVTISGVVYQDDGVTPATAPLCNASTEVVTVVLDGVTTYTAPCDPVDGSFAVTGIVYTGEPQITTYIGSNATAAETNVAIFDELTGTGVVAGNTMTVSRPTVMDDTMLVLIAGKDDDINFGTAAGWTLVDGLGNTAGDDIATGIWYRVVADAGTEPATYNFPVTDNGEEYSYWMGSLMNVDTVTPVDVAGSWTKLQNQAAPTASGLTTLTNGALVFSAWYVFNDAEVVPPLYQWDTRAANVIGSLNNLSVSSRRLTTAGASGDATLVSVIDTRESHAGQFAFRPAAAPTATSSMVAAAVTKTPLGNTTPYDTVTQRDQRTGFGTVAAGSTFNVNRPAVENGDVLVAIVARDDDFTLTPPAGWLVGDTRAETTGNDMFTGVWYRAVTNAGSEPSSYSFTSADTTAEEYNYWIGSFLGVDTVDVFDVAPSWSNLQNTSSPVAPAITTVRDGAYALAAWYVIDDGAMNMPGAPWTTLAQDIEWNNRLLAVAGQSMTAVGNTSAATLTGGSVDDVNVVQFSLNPVALSVADQITDMDLYQNRLIVRHENISPLSVADMALFDNDDESDLPFTATVGSPDALSVEPGVGLYVWGDKEFAPAGTVSLAGRGTSAVDGSLTLGGGASFTSSGANGITIGGSFFAETGASFAGASSTVTFAATSTGQQIGSAASSTLTFYDVAFTGVGGGWTVQTPLISLTDILVGAGTVSGVADITVETGSFTGTGVVDITDGTTLIKRTNTLGGNTPWSFYNLTLGDGLASGVTTRAANATTTVRNTLTIATAHFLDAFGSRWDLSGTGNAFVESGTFLEGTSTVRYSGAAPNVTRTAYHHLVIDTESGGSVSATAPVTGLQVLGDFIVGALGTSTLNVNTNDPLFAVGGDVYIGTRGTLEASDTNVANVFGSWDNDGVFTANGGTVEFLQATGTATVAAGASTFANVLVQGGADFTFTESATATADFNLGAGAFALLAGETLSVGGSFTNNMVDGSTDWTNTTLYLYSGTAFTINDQSTGDTYETIITTNGTHPRVWNSSAALVTTSGTSSLYSMDHQDVAGSLYIYGDFESAGFDDHWSYTEDFDGTALGGGARAVSVQVEDGGSALYTGGSLTVHGTATASTTIAAMGAGPYELTIGGTTTADFLHTVIREITSDGLIFTGSPDVTDILNVDLEVAIADGTAMTVGGSVINANQARNFTNNRFATTTAINAYNVTATGTSVSSWRFVNVDGNLDGEAKDIDPGGDPGYIVWTDSAAIINISGTVYGDEGAIVSSVCDGVTNNIHLSVGGLTFASTSCAVSTGVYSFTDIGYGPSDTLTVWIDGEAEKAATVSQDPISSIGNMDLYENRVIVRHEAGAPLTIADMAVWDSSNDADIPFTAVVAATDTLTLPADRKLIVWTDKEFAPGGDVTLSGGGAGAAYDGTLELYGDATFTAANGEVHTIGGSLISGTGAVFDAAQSTVTFTSTTAGRTIDTNDDNFHHLSFAGPGSWTISDTELLVHGDYTQSAGTVTLPAATSTVGGSFTVSGGSWNANGGTLYFTATDTGNDVTFGGSDAARVTFNGLGGTWLMSDTNATATAGFTVATGTVTLPAGVLAVGNDFVVADTMLHGGGTLRLSGTGGGNVLTLAGNDLSSLVIDAGAGDYTLTDVSAALVGDLAITSGELTVGNGTLSIAGSFDAAGGTFDNGAGTVLFNSSGTGETINPGSNDFYNVIFAGVGGGWTVSSHATATNNFTLSTGNSFTQATATTLYVGGVFTNNLGGPATEWIGSTLVLDAGVEYETNLKTTPAEQYNILELGANTDISSWNAAATSTIVPANSSWYSQDHAGTNGAIYIYGDYHIATTTEYWSYATDFDGTALGGGSRAVNVQIASSSTITLDGGTLNVIGQANSTSTITNQGAGLYTFTIDSGTFNADYYSFRNVDSAGLTFSGNASVTSLDNGDFEQAAASTTLITLAATTLNANAGLTITNTRFDNGGFLSGTNVSLDATSTNSWSFTGAAGNLWGEAYDIDGTDNCSSIRFDDSECLLTEQAHYRWRNDDGGEGAVPGTWYNNNWSARQRVRVINHDNAAYSDVAVKLNVAYDADMQTDFDDLRFTDASGTTTLDYWIERFTTGNEADVWIRMPMMASSSVSEVYMYYGNVSATSSADASNVFTIHDDFDDNNITEYSGDTTKFATAGTYAYGGGYGLDASPDPNDRATDGIARTDLTVSQGDIIRYMQYVDTSAGSGDEVCTMFAVQNPVTTNQNYAVCLEQFGIDRISLVENVENTDSTGTVLASSTITFATGWYEVEIDWQTDGTMDVSVFDDAGTLQATTSATDNTYTSGGIGFTFWFQHGGWDSYVAWPRTETKPTVRFGAEQTEGGATWAAAQDTAVGGFAFGETARLRIGIENTGLAIDNQNFRLEYAPKLTAPSCEAVAGASFSAVPVAASCGSSAICMTTSASTTNGDPTTDHLVTAAGDFVAGQIMTNTSNQTSNLDLGQNRYTELEYAVNLTVNAVNDAYCFRVTNAGAALDSYALLPELTLAFDPVLNTVALNGGFDITLNPGATTTIIASTTVTDLNGVADLASATTTFYKTSVGAACTPDNNNCYIASSTDCSFSGCSGTSCTLSCSADFQFHADATDNDGGEEWFAFMEVSDLSGATDFDTSPGVELLTLRALEVQNAIGYGTVDINENTGSFNPSVSLLNFGNEAIDVEISGTDMTDGLTSVIPAAQQRYATSTFDYASCITCSNLTVTGERIELDLGKPTTDTPPVTDDIYWGIEVPFGTASNPHSGINLFTAVAD